MVLDDVQRSLKVFWEKASLWSDRNEMLVAKQGIDEAERKLKKWKKELAELKGKRIKSAEERKREAEIQSQTMQVPFFKGRRERLESIVARLENNLALAKAHWEGAHERAEHAKRELKKLGKVI